MDELQKLKHRIENCTDEMERIGLTKVYDKLLKLRYAFLHCFQAILAMFYEALRYDLKVGYSIAKLEHKFNVMLSYKLLLFS